MASEIGAVQTQTGWLLHKKKKKKDTLVRPALKYSVFGFNVFLWLVGLLLIVAGTWAEAQKEAINKVGGVTDVMFDPAALLIIFGIIFFIVGFTGCIGALRENRHVLLAYIIAICVILAIILIGILVIYLTSQKVIDNFRKKMKEFIVDYRDDVDKQNMIDWIQGEFLMCCGADNPNDWDSNAYFKCGASTREQCGVPFSCCIVPPDQVHENLQCGYDTRIASTLGEPGKANLDSVDIYGEGCIDVGIKFLKEHLLPIVCVVAVVVVIMIFMLVIVILLRNDVIKQKQRWEDRRAAALRRKSRAATLQPKPESPQPETRPEPAANEPPPA